MPAPSPLAITTSSVQRLLKEEASYHKEVTDQEKTVKDLEAKLQAGGADEDGNEAFMVKQNKTAIEQTKAVFEPLKQRIADSVAKLEDQLAAAEQAGAPEAEITQAKTVLAQAKAAA
ncbi:tubulin-specific chaperone Rbl2, putative [Cordyceps militaris CM01]|uniref:Tubulin-specific chaperone A n=1 Tax=Cordyceps militaris (strain CM01) TaxID=983644 RepID=G3JJI2_CORMM|nr:tubulin-specific chaperone Rbl2, putative [Cordyceps militaris CM01]EGX92070.1 tubulin-specific chaperone Rbl2, putative [Cordyceps militaris CM01]